MRRRDKFLLGILFPAFVVLALLDVALTPASAQIRAGLVNLATMVTGDLPFANLTQGSALSVLGVTGNSTADHASIAAGNDAEVLRRSGTSIGFGTVATAGIANDAVTNGKLADMASLTVKVRASNSSGDPSDVALSDGHTAKRVGTAVVSARYGWVSTTTIVTGTTSYTVPAGVYRIFIRGVGPGGGGGGGDQGGAGASGAAGGGGAGGYFEGWRAVTPGDSFTVAVGAKGAGGTAGNNAGTAGTAATVFDSGGTAWTGNLGSGGASMAAGTALAASVGGAGGTATGTGATLINGQAGEQSIRTASNVFRSGKGGNSPMGEPGPFLSAGTPSAPTGYGSGGTGGSAFTASADVPGGDGADGVIIVEEFN